MGSEDLLGQRSPVITQQGVTVLAKRVVAQNSLNYFASDADKEGKVQFFATSDPESTSHWLKQVRVGMFPDDSGQQSRSVTAETAHSQQVNTTIITYHRCDRVSCLGCRYF
jgi:hypothetical protein